MIAEDGIRNVGMRTTRGTDNGASIRRCDGGWRSNSLRIGHSVKVLVQCVIWLVY